MSRAKEGSLLSPPFPPYFFSQLLWLCAAFQILNAWNRLELNRSLHRFINTYPRTLNLQHWCNAVLLRYINRAEITVFMFELVVWFLCWRQIYPVYCVNIALSSLLATPTNVSINHAIFYIMLSNFLVRVTPKIPNKTLSLSGVNSSTNWSVWWKMIPYSRPKHSVIYSIPEQTPWKPLPFTAAHTAVINT